MAAIQKHDPEMHDPAEEVLNNRRIASFAVLDLETTNLPAYNFNKVAITELCIYGFAVEDLEKLENCGNSTEHDSEKLLSPPRILHKLKILFNPRMMVHPAAEQITGLSNYTLEKETSFDENAANLILGFLNHMQKPICLVAHNGWDFDFPIIKQTFAKLQMSLPGDMLCVDSLKAFFHIDEQILLEIKNNETTSPVTELEEPTTSIKDDLVDNLNAQSKNESTPQSQIISSGEAAVKRKLLADASFNLNINNSCTPLSTKNNSKRLRTLKSRRSLFSEKSCTTQKSKKFPPKGVYQLSNLYERIFKTTSSVAHHAEGDVHSLMMIILHYGLNFLAYAEENAIPLAEVRKLGVSTNL